MKLYDETNINAQIMRVMDEEKGFVWDTRLSERGVKMLFEGIAKYLGTVKNKNAVMGCQVRDLKSDQFCLGAFVESMTSEDGESSFALTFTFNEDDMKDIPRKNIALINDMVFHYTIGDVGRYNYGIGLEVVNGHDYLADILCVTARAIQDYMIANVDIDDEMEIPDFVHLKAERDGNNVIISITPYEILKQHVKDDKVSEKVSDETVAAYSPKDA